MKLKASHIIAYIALILAASYAGYTLVQYLSPVTIPARSRQYGEGKAQGWDVENGQPAEGNATDNPTADIAVTTAGNRVIKADNSAGANVGINSGAAAINRMFFADRALIADAVPTATETPAKPDPGPQLQLVLSAVFPGKDAGAVLMRKGEFPEGQSWLVKVGDSVADATVVSIGKDHIVLDAAGTKVTINLE
jgi:hypothetical protein